MASRKMIFIASDHNGNEYRKIICKHLHKNFHIVVDLGPDTKGDLKNEKVDYIDYANQMGYIISSNKSFLGILICGTGVGMSIAANRYKNVRASLVKDCFTAKKTREHNASNVLCLGAWNNTIDEVIEIIDTWLNEPYARGRHEKRVERLNEHSDNDIVLVPGVFDMVHPGHIKLLSFAKNLGRVVVLLNSDKSAKKLNGYKPANAEFNRRLLLENLDIVDEVILNDDLNISKYFDKMNVSYVVKGSEFDEDFIRENDKIPDNVEVKLFQMDERFSSDRIRKAIKDA